MELSASQTAPVATPAKRLVLQSWRNLTEPAWIGHCMASVRRWSAALSAQYRFVDDALFDCVPQWYQDKIGGRRAIAADYARLVLAQRALEEGYDEVIWLDADCLVLRDSPLPDCTTDCAFGREYWVESDQKGRWRVRSSVHNAYCLFRRDGVTLPFLMQTVSSIIRRVDPAHIAPQMVGPKLLSALQPIAGFSAMPAFGALSPAVLNDIYQGGGPALDHLRGALSEPLIAVNVCASLESASGVPDYLHLVSDRIPSLL